MPPLRDEASEEWSTEILPTVRDEASGPEASTEVLPVVPDEASGPGRRRRSRRAQRKANPTVAAEITEQYSKLTGEITQVPEGR